jgi:hypothetical protein
LAPPPPPTHPLVAIILYVVKLPASTQRAERLNEREGSNNFGVLDDGRWEGGDNFVKILAICFSLPPIFSFNCSFNLLHL